VPGILGITAADLAQMGVGLPLALDKSYLQILQNANIQTIELRGKQDGLYVYMNNDPLPNIVWDETFLNNAADAWVQLNPGAEQVPGLVPAVKMAVPLISKADIDIMVHFPVAAGQKPLAVKMH
jgi:hypothetical protein